MRTLEQIDNLRNVLYRMVGVYALFLTDYQVNAWADAFQRYINKRNGSWLIKVRLEDDSKKSWEDINFEPNHPVCSFQELSCKCYELLEKYPKIIAIQVYNNADYLDNHIFERKEPELQLFG